ncbi:hypothetical protein BU23DRAFT_439959, partial [Bimuria novae-zelandiae CBS 107.79]
TVQGPWAQRLREHCSVRNLGEPSWQDVSDRRGKRTAWSSIVLIQGAQYYARYWYAGERLEQAREDAAEVALRQLTGFTRPGQEPPPA